VVGVWGKRCEGCWVLSPLCLLGCIFVVVMEGTCVKDYRDLGLCAVGIVG
jgi:hypothetical protein